jgi:hypothetical protein
MIQVITEIEETTIYVGDKLVKITSERKCVRSLPDKKK